MNEMTTAEQTEAFTKITIADALESGRKDQAITLMLETMTLNAAIAAALPARTPVVGDILVSSWGYDQVNIDFYQVIAVTAKSVRIREISSKRIGTADTSDVIVPVPGSFVELASWETPSKHNAIKTAKGATKRINAIAARTTGDGVEAARYSVSISSYASAYLWSGEAQHQTGAAFGH
jgi:hypothetical protein